MLGTEKADGLLPVCKYTQKGFLMSQSFWQPAEFAALLGLFGTSLSLWANYRFSILLKKIDQVEKDKDREVADYYKKIDLMVNERARQLDIYKTIYSEKFKKAQMLMEAATVCYNELSSLSAVKIQYAIDLEVQRERLSVATQNLHDITTTTQWLLGSNVHLCAAQLVSSGGIVASFKGVDEELLNHIQTSGYENLFDNLTQSVREELTLNQLELLLPSANKQIAL